MATQINQASAPPASGSRPINPFNMPRPTFTGRHDEDVEMYITLCEFAWINSGLSTNDLTRAKLATLYTGLSGVALDFVQLLSREVRHSYTELCKKLRERFPLRGCAVNSEEVISRMDDIKQENLTFDEYVDVGRNFHHALVDDLYQDILMTDWVHGLKDKKMASDIQNNVDADRDAREKYNMPEMTFEDVVGIASEFQ